jgi:pyrroline-5-carboxylate reductase
MPPTSAGTASTGVAGRPLGDRAALGGRSAGIVGAGRLGSALALALLNRGLPRERLRLSIGGGPVSRGRLEEAGLADLAVPASEAAASCDIVVIALRPQDAALIGPIRTREDCAVLSCMAAVPLEAVRRLAGSGTARGMTSGPDTIVEGRGAAAICPADSGAAELLEFLGLRLLRLDDESLVDAFTAAVCMPAALARVGAAAAADMERLAMELPPIAPIFRWAVEVLPEFASKAEREAYVARMITPGGITERIVASLSSGSPVRDAYFAGIARAGEIAASFRSAT